MRSPSTANSRLFRMMAVALLLPLFVSGLASGSAAADPGWHRQDSGTFSHLQAVFFLDQTLGWAAGVKGTLLRTEDGGATWKSLKRPTDDSIRDLAFWNRREGWALCERSIFLMKSMNEVRSYLLHTTDGGENWSRVDLDFTDSETRFMRLVFSGDGRGWLFGEAGELYLTADRGQTWKRQVPPSRYLLLGGTFVDANHGWLVGGGATIAHTIDGTSWRTTVVRNAPGARFAAVAFANVNRGWVVGNGGRIYSSGDGGRSWTRQKSGTDVDLSDVRFVDQSEGWAIGAAGTVLHTQDGGVHWDILESGTTHPLERLAVLDQTHGWIVGFGGTILSLTRSEREAPPVLRSK